MINTAIQNKNEHITAPTRNWRHRSAQKNLW
jgi:hypothetical protein